MKRVPELDGLRGIAILLVIGCHYAVFAGQLGGLPKYGWVGVDLFFVLSGFLITSVLLKLRGRPGAFRQFYVRRIRRIIPPYAAFLVLLYIATAALGDYALYRKGTILRNLLFMQSFGNVRDTIGLIISGKTFSLAHGYIGPVLAGLPGPVSNSWGVLWSLSIEEYYYVLWAPVVLWMARRGAATTGIGVCLIALAVRWLAFAGTGGYFSIYHRLDAPVLGSFVAFLLASKLAHRTAIVVLTGAGLAGLATLTLILVPMGNFLGREIRQDHSFMVFGLPSLSLIAAAAVGISVMNSGSSFLALLRLNALRFLGKISYMLYLLHGFVYLCFLHFFRPTWGISLCALGFAVLLSWLSWTYLERPILEGGREDIGSSSVEAKLASAA